MFVNKEHRLQILSADCYYSQEQFDAEMKCLFRPAWHCVALASELPREGSFRTLDLFGNPLILCRSNGEVHAFLNVCAHRFDKPAGAACGRTVKLKWQNHGWEFDETGKSTPLATHTCGGVRKQHGLTATQAHGRPAPPTQVLRSSRIIAKRTPPNNKPISPITDHDGIHL